MCAKMTSCENDVISGRGTKNRALTRSVWSKHPPAINPGSAPGVRYPQMLKKLVVLATVAVTYVQGNAIATMCVHNEVTVGVEGRWPCAYPYLFLVITWCILNYAASGGSDPCLDPDVYPCFSEAVECTKVTDTDFQEWRGAVHIAQL